MKKDKHITINLNEAQYNAVLMIAEASERTPSDVARLLLLKALNNDIAEKTIIYNGDFKPLTWK